MSNNQKSAFPIMLLIDENGIDETEKHQSIGLTKREYFAIRALQSIILLKCDQSHRDDVLSAVEYADLLISELEEKPSRKIHFVSKNEAIEALKQGKTVYHRFFGDDESIKQVDENFYQGEDGIVFPQADFWAVRTNPE